MFDPLHFVTRASRLMKRVAVILNLRLKTWKQVSILGKSRVGQRNRALNFSISYANSQYLSVVFSGVQDPPYPIVSSR